MTLFDEAPRIVEQAARNNALWCDAVCRSHGRPGEFHDALWLNRYGTPKFYPDAVTLSTAEDTSAWLQAISNLMGSSGNRSWAVKDSFASLDLKALGFVPLFEAEWIGLKPGPAEADGLPHGHSCADMLSEEELAAWEEGWSGDAPSPGAEPVERTFLPGLLDDADVRFVSVRLDDRIVGGGILNRGAGVVGLSNCFVRDAAPEDVWRALVSHAGKTFPGLTLVGYESGADLDTAHRVGFEALGMLRVWCTPE